MVGLLLHLVVLPELVVRLGLGEVILVVVGCQQEDRGTMGLDLGVGEVGGEEEEVLDRELELVYRVESGGEEREFLKDRQEDEEEATVEALGVEIEADIEKKNVMRNDTYHLEDVANQDPINIW